MSALALPSKIYSFSDKSGTKIPFFLVFVELSFTYNLGFEIHKPSREISKDLFFKGLRGIALRAELAHILHHICYTYTTT